MRTPGAGQMNRFSPSRAPPKPTPTGILLVCFLALYLYLLTRHLGVGSLPWDESVHASSGLTILDTAPLLLTNSYAFFTEYLWRWPYYPPVYSFLEAASFMALGISEFSARIVSVLISIAGLAITYQLSKTLYNKTTALLSAIVLASMPVYFTESRSAILDVPACFFFTLTISLFALGYTRRDERWVYLGGIILAVGFLTKYPVALAAPAVLLYLGLEAISARGRPNRNLRPTLLALLIALCLSSVWIGVDLIGLEQWKAWLGTVQVGTKYEILPGLSEPSNWTWYAVDPKGGWIGQMSLTTAVLGGVSLLYAALRRREGDRLLLSWIVVVYLLLSLSHEKDPRYTMPYLPAFAILISAMIVDGCSAASTMLNKPFRKNAKPTITTMLSLAVVFLLTFQLFTGFYNVQPRQTIPIREATKYLSENLNQGENLAVLLITDTLNTNTVMFYMRVHRQTRDLQIFPYPDTPADLSSIREINVTEFSSLCKIRNVRYALIYMGAPWSETVLNQVLSDPSFSVEKVVDGGNRVKTILILAFNFSPTIQSFE